MTTAKVRYFVKGSWPQSFVTWLLVYIEKDEIPLDGLFVSIGDGSDEVLLGLPIRD